MGKLMLGQLIEDIALILVLVMAPQEKPAAGSFVIGNTGVMAGGNGIGAMLQCPVQQSAELDFPVAVDTGVGRAAADIFGNKFMTAQPSCGPWASGATTWCGGMGLNTS